MEQGYRFLQVCKNFDCISLYETCIEEKNMYRGNWDRLKADCQENIYGSIILQGEKGREIGLMAVL